MDDPRLLTINTGSSSLKAALYRVDCSAGEKETPELTFEAGRIGSPESVLWLEGERGDTLEESRGELPDHRAGRRALLDELRARGLDRHLAAVGHRVVHGGSRYRGRRRITTGLLGYLRELVPIDPEHMPQSLAAIEEITRAYSALPQVACFDSAFYRRMPRVARLYALPRWLRRQEASSATASTAFLEEQLMVVLGSVETDCRVWASLLVSELGFVRVLDERTVRIDATPLPGDPRRLTCGWCRDGARGSRDCVQGVFSKVRLTREGLPKSRRTSA